MPVPIIYLDEEMRQFAERFQKLFSRPQYQHFVTVLLPRCIDNKRSVQFKWPKGKKTVYVHVVTTRVCSFYRCQVVIVRQSLDAPVSQARYRASGDYELFAA